MEIIVIFAAFFIFVNAAPFIYKLCELTIKQTNVGHCLLSVFLLILYIVTNYYACSDETLINVCTCVIAFFPLLVYLSSIYVKHENKGKIKFNLAILRFCSALLLLFTIEGVLRIIGSFSFYDFELIVLKCSNIFEKYSHYHETSTDYVFCGISLISFLITISNSSFINDKRSYAKTFVKVLAYAMLFYTSINAIQKQFFFNQEWYNCEKGLVSEDEAISATENFLLQIKDNQKAFANVFFNANKESVDDAIGDFIKSISKNGTPFIINDKTYVSSISCDFSNKGLQAICLHLRQFNEDNAIFYKHSLRTDSHDYYSYLYEVNEDNFDALLDFFNHKYGEPIHVGDNSNRYLWNKDNIIIILNNFYKYDVDLVYASNEYILKIIHELETAKYKELKELKSIETQRKNDSIKNAHEDSLKEVIKQNNLNNIKETTSNSI